MLLFNFVNDRTNKVASKNFPMLYAIEKYNHFHLIPCGSEGLPSLETIIKGTK